MLLKSFSSCCLPSSSYHLHPTYLVEGLLKLMPVVIEVLFALIMDVLSKDGLQSTEASRGFFIAHDAHNDHRWCFHNGHILHNFLLVHFGSWPVDLSHNVSHASLVAQEGCEVDRFGRFILGEALHLPMVPATVFLGQEVQGPMSGSREFPMRHSAAKCKESKKFF
uniref:Uncharacterized protein n=2 Tax=Canis lupus familiaris TaxID=9615 RepID=A0A8P0PMF1_CANLF